MRITNSSDLANSQSSNPLKFVCLSLLLECDPSIFTRCENTQILTNIYLICLTVLHLKDTVSARHNQLNIASCCARGMCVFWNCTGVGVHIY